MPHRRDRAMLPLLALIVALASGCLAPPPDLPAPPWGDDERPQWVAGESWTYALDARPGRSYIGNQTGTLVVTVESTDASLDGDRTILQSWVWQGHRGPDARTRWDIWLDADSLAWVQVAVVRDDGSRAVEDARTCPMAPMLARGNATTQCVDVSGPVPVRSTVEQKDLGWVMAETPYGPLRARDLAWTSDLGAPVKGTYAPAVGHWATFTVDAPQDSDGAVLRTHRLTAHHDPR